MRPLSVLIPTAIAAVALTACGTESVSVPSSDAAEHDGAEIFATHCAGCHTISAAGTQGSGNRQLRVQGPNFDQRVESYDDVLFAIRNGGFSGAIMPQNIVVGDEAEAIAAFLAEYSGSDVEEPPRPESESETGTGPEAGEGEGSVGAGDQGAGGQGTEGEGAPTGDPDAGSSSDPNSGG